LFSGPWRGRCGGLAKRFWGRCRRRRGTKERKQPEIFCFEASLIAGQVRLCFCLVKCTVGVVKETARPGASLWLCLVNRQEAAAELCPGRRRGRPTRGRLRGAGGGRGASKKKRENPTPALNDTVRRPTRCQPNPRKKQGLQHLAGRPPGPDFCLGGMAKRPAGKT